MSWALPVFLVWQPPFPAQLRSLFAAKRYFDVNTETNRVQELERLFRERIVIIDGAMGTRVQQHKLEEAAYRGDRFRSWTKDLVGLHDLLCLTQPQLIEDIHREYFEAGADLIE